MTGAIAVVEQVLGIAVVHSDDRELQHAIGGHGLEPNHAGGRFFSRADQGLYQVGAVFENCRNQVGTIVHSDLRVVIERGLQVAVVGCIVFALDRKNRDFLIGHQRCRNIILGRERVRGGQHYIGTADGQHLHQIRRFCRHMQTGRNLDALQWALFLEALADEPQHRHFLLGPVDPLAALLGQAQVLDVVVVSQCVLPLVNSSTFKMKSSKWITAHFEC